MEENNINGVNTPIDNSQPAFGDTPMPQENNIPAEPVETPVAPVAEPAAPVEAPVEPAPVAEQPVAPVEPVAPVVPTEPAPIAEQPVAPAPAEEPKKKSKLPIIIIVLILLVALGVGGFFVYKSIVSKPKNIVDSTIDLLVNKTLFAKNELKDRLKFDFKKDTIESSGNITLSFEGSTGEYKQLADLGKVGINYDAIVSVPNKQLSFSLSYLEGDNKIISGEGFYKDKKIYYQFPDLIKQAFYIDVPEEIDIDKILDENIKSVSFENYDKLIAKLKQYLKNAIKEEYLVQENGTYQVDAVEIKGLKTSFDLSEAREIDIENSVMKQMLEDSEFIKLYVDFFPVMSEEELRKEIEDSIKFNDEELKNATGDVEATINIYSNDLGKFLAFEVIAKEKDEEGKDKDRIIITSVEKENDMNITKINAQMPAYGAASIVTNGATDTTGETSFTMDNTSIMPKDDMTNCVDDPTGMTNCGGGVTYEHLTDCAGDESGLTDCMVEVQPYPVTTKDVQIVITTDRKNKFTLVKADKLTLKISKVSNGYSFNFEYDTLVVNGTLTFDYKDKNEKEEFKLDVKADDMKVNVNANGETKLVDGIKTFDIANAKKMEELTQEEYQTMNTNLGLKLMTSKVYMAFAKALQEAMANMQQSQTTYDEYPYDY